MTTQPPHRPPDYVLGVDADEDARLGFQHRLWSDLTHRAWIAARAAPGQTVLDLGSGPGHATFDLASLVQGPDPARPLGAVHAIDQSATYLDRLNLLARARGLTNITTHPCDAHNLASLNLPHNSFDFIYTRWFLCFVRDPQSIINAVANLLRPATHLAPAGRFAVNDYFNYEAMTLAPRRPSFTRVIHAIGASWRDRGGDPDIIGRLPTLCSNAGLKMVHLSVDQRLATPADTMWHWPASFWRTYIPRLVSTGHITQLDADAFFADWNEASEDPNSFMAMPPVYTFIAEKP